MKKKIKLWLVIMMMVSSFIFGVMSVSAAKDEAESRTGSTQNTGQTVHKKGWVKEGKYYLYYSSSGKMYTGWKKIGKYVYYFRKKASGESPVGSRMTGPQNIGKYTYYFNKKGVLLTGWQSINGGTYYFRSTGKLGKLGRMYTGLKTLNKKYYYFGTTGKVATGWTEVNGKKYYFSKSKVLGTRGSAYIGWKTIGKYRYYFDAEGVCCMNQWITTPKAKYYVDEKGRKLTNCITPDGYIVNSSGVRVKQASGWIKSDGEYYYYTSGKKAVGWKKIGGKYYYFDANGVRQLGWVTVNGSKYYLKKYRLTGWQIIDGKKYYCKSDGKMAVSTTVDGITLGADGVAVTPVKNGTSVLLIAGHGQGDSGAVGTYGSTIYYEYKQTREFASLIYNELKSAGTKLTVTMYDQNYDCYQQNAQTLGSKGANISFTGSGAKKAKVLSAIQKSTVVPDFTQYDYVLEIHFNATAESNKDPKGDGKQKGIGMYINSYKAQSFSDYAIDRNIIAAVAKQTGFKVWGGGAGIFSSPTLFNAKTCQELGVSYGLLETAFIDDKDDMDFYNKNKAAMAKAVAGAIISSLL